MTANILDVFMFRASRPGNQKPGKAGPLIEVETFLLLAPASGFQQVIARPATQSP
jgi:hypothetical protein